MKQYSVLCQVTAKKLVLVEAENIEDAKRIAVEELTGNPGKWVWLTQEVEPIMVERTKYFGPAG